MGGKRQANVLSAIIKNFDTVEDVIQTSLNSEGSAYKENEKYLDSIQGRIDLFNNSVQTMWSNFIDTDVVKFIVDIGTAFVKLADTIGVIPTAVGAFVAYKSAVQGLKEVFDDTNISAKDFRKTIVDYINGAKNATAAKVEGAAATEVETQAEVEKTAATEMSNNASIEKTVVTSESATADQIEGQMSLFDAEANQQEANASTDVANAKANEAVQLYETSEADQIEGQMSFFNADAHTPKSSGDEGTSAGVGFFSKLIGGATKAGAAIKVLGAALGKAAVVMLAVKAATFVIGKAWDALDKNVIHRADNIKKEVEALKSSYDDAKKTFESNLKTLTTSSDVGLYSTLQDEFAVLAQGVDQYGNNISLTSDQYERYKSICEQIVGIQPSIAAGYDSATKAIGNNVNVLSQLIELQKIQMRKNTDESISDDSLGKIVENSHNNVSATASKNYQVKQSANNKLKSVLLEKFYKDTKEKKIHQDQNENGYINDEFIEGVLRTLGVENAAAKAQSYWSGDLNDYDVSRFISDYADQIEQNTEKFGEEYKAVLDDTFGEIKQAIESSAEDMKAAQDGLVDTFLLVPQGTKAGQYYDKLNDASKKFVTDWIKNGDQFKTDNNKTEDAATANRDKIIKMVKDLSSEAVKINFNGKQFTGQEFLDNFYNLDTTNINWGKYKEQKQQMLDAFWDSIGGDQNEYGVTKESLKVSFGIEFVNDEAEANTKAKETKSQVAEMIGKNEEELQEWLNTLPATKVQKFYEIDWNKVDNSKIESFDDIEAEINKQIIPANAASVKTYSVLQESVEKFNDILSQTNEVVSDNTTVTQEYKDSLTSLGLSQEDLNDVFDEGNPLLVKNAALLRKLVIQKRAEKQATIQAAKAQTQLQYRNTVKQLQQVVAQMGNEYKATGLVTDATRKAADVLRSQLTALRQAQREYALLEIQLSGATSAYENFAKAKELDSKLTYGDSMIEMLNTINDGFKTGQVGTEAFRAAVETLVPSSVYSDLDNFNDRMVAIHDYIDKNPLFADWFTIKDGQFSITQENIQSFVEDAQKAGAFTSSDENGNFFLGEGVNTIDDFVAKLNEGAEGAGVTKEAVVAMLTEFSKYDASWSDILSDLTTNPLDKDINKATTALEKAVLVQDEYIRSGKSLDGEEWQTICKNVTDAKTALDNANGAAAKNASEYAQLEAIYNSSTGKLKMTAEQANALAKSLGLVDANGQNLNFTVDDNGTIQLTTEQAEILNKKKEALEKPSILTAQARYDDVVKQIDELQKYIDGKLAPEEVKDIQAKYNIQNQQEAKDMINNILNPEKNTIQLEYGITKTSDAQDGTIEKLQTWEANGMTFTVSAKVDEESTTAAKEEKEELGEDENPTVYPDVDETSNNAANEAIDYTARDRTCTITVNKKNGTDSTGGIPGAAGQQGGVNGTAHANGTAYASGNWGVKQDEKGSLVGELGTETLVRNGKWQTIGENGAEMVNLKKGDIIFNHLQTEQLLKNGHITSRGKMIGGQSFAEGNAHYDLFNGYTNYDEVFKNGSNEWVEAWTNSIKNLSGAADAVDSAGEDISDAADKFEEMFDWFAVLLEEIDSDLNYMSAALENAVGISAKNDIQEQMINVNKLKLTELGEGYKLYADYAAKLLEKVPQEYQELAKNGGVKLTEFLGEANQEVVEAINNYREWAQKAADVRTQQQEVRKEITSISLQKVQTIADEYDRVITKITTMNDLIQANIDLIDEQGGRVSSVMYEEMIKNSKKELEELQKQRDAMQKEFDAQVSAGNIEVNSEEWYEGVAAIQEVDKSMLDCTKSIEEFQNSINQLHWDNFEKIIDAIDNVGTELSNLKDLIKDEDVTDDVGNWTDKGVTALGLLAQEMERAQYRSKQYADEIEYLNKEYAAGKYSVDEYNEKLQELKDGQWDSIKSYEAAKDAIIELNKARIESVKDGINKELEAYQKLIDTKKKELQLSKD